MSKTAASARPPTAKALRALRLLAERGPLAPSEFAKLYWPESGGRMAQSAGCYLARLRRLGLVRRSPDEFGQRPRYELTTAGRAELGAAPQLDLPGTLPMTCQRQGCRIMKGRSA